MGEQSVIAEQPPGAPATDWLQGLLRGRPPSLITTLAWTLVVVPALLTLLYIGLYAVNGPEWDHLTSAEIFDRWDNGTFTFEYLFRPHNEHRKAVPRLVVLGFGKLTRFNNPDEMYLQWALLCGAVAVLFAAFRREARLLDSRVRALVLFAPVAGLLVSVRQYEILLVGDGLLTYLSLIFFVTAVYLLAFGGRSRARFGGAVTAGVLTSFSQSNGLLVWPIGLLLLLCDVRVSTERRPAVLRAAIWAVVGTATITAYFHGYHDPGNHPSPRYVLGHPAVALAHFLAVGGGSLAPEMRSAVALGTIMLALECVMGLVILDEWWRGGQRPPFGVWLVTCAVTTQVMITLNRAGFGMGQGLSPRYATYSCLAPIGLYWCATVRRDRWGLSQPLAIALGTLMMVGLLAGTLDGWTHGPSLYAEHNWQAYLLYTAKYQPSSLLLKLYPNPEHARIYSAALERLHLNVFADDHVRADRLALTSVRPLFAVDLVNGKPPDPGAPIDVGAEDAVVVAGWALDSSGRGPASALFLTVDGTLDIPGHMGIYRPDLGGNLRLRGRRWGDFVGSFAGAVLTPGEHTLALKIVDRDRALAFVSAPVARIIRK